MTEYFEKLYRDVTCKWGLKPDFLLVNFLELFPKGLVLDLGIGEGRNALFLAENGFEVEGVDISKTAVDRCLQLAKERKVNIKVHVGDLRDFEIPEERYSLIIAAGASLNFFKKSEIEEIVARMRKGVKRGFRLYFSSLNRRSTL